MIFLKKLELLFISQNSIRCVVERQILLNNVFSELRHKELNIATHSGVTRTLEGFLPLFSPYKLRAFLYHLRQRYLTTRACRVSCVVSLMTVCWCCPAT
jgi:hypothetical protein